LKLCHAPWREFLIESGQMLFEGNRMRRKIDEDMAVPNRGGDCVQRIVGFAEALYFFHMRRVGQCAVELIGPGVILALNAAREFAFVLLAKHSAAMAAHIVKGSDIACLVPRD